MTARVRDTKGSFNLEVVEVTGEHSLDEMHAALETVAADLGMQFSHITRLGTKRYPGNRHWHLKQDLKTRGCLDVTYWPAGPLMWITIRKSEPPWVHEAGRALQPALRKYLRTTRTDYR